MVFLACRISDILYWPTHVPLTLDLWNRVWAIATDQGVTYSEQGLPNHNKNCSCQRYDSFVKFRGAPQDYLEHKGLGDCRQVSHCRISNLMLCTHHHCCCLKHKDHHVSITILASVPSPSIAYALSCPAVYENAVDWHTTGVHLSWTRC